VNPPIVYGQPCADCRRPMIPQSRRRAPVPVGMARHHGGGLCNSCYHKRPRSTGHGRRGPYSDVDEIAVQRAIRGDPPARLNSGEITAAVTWLTLRGLSAAVIAGRLGVTPRTVTRARARVRLSNGHSAAVDSEVRRGHRGNDAPDDLLATPIPTEEASR
jgi:hypothetical protein